MTTYKTTTYETAEDLRNAINADLATLTYPYTVKHRIYGEGQLTSVKAPEIGNSLFVTIDFAAGTKTISLDIAFASKLLKMPEILTDTLVEAQSVFKADFVERETAKSLYNQKLRKEAEAAAKKAAEDKKNEEKYKKIVEKALKDFEARTQVEKAVSAADEFYYSLGWLTKHAGSVTAVLPDYLENAFVKHFGTEAPRRVVDSKHRGPAGWQPQWSWSFTASIKKPDLIPAFLASKLNPSGNKVSDTSFVWDLVDNYGFQFGKKQDIEKIRSHVPANYLASFEAGLA